MKFALIQMNPTVGAVKNNAAKILRFAQEAAAGYSGHAHARYEAAVTEV